MTGTLRRRPSAVFLTVLFATLVSVCSWPVDNYIPSDKVRETGGPVIYPPQNEIVLQKGQNYTLYCKSKNEIQFKHQEMSEEASGLFQMSQSSVASDDASRPHAVALQLQNVDEFSVGYYACFDSEQTAGDVLTNVLKEPADTAHVSYIYVYVDGLDTLFAPMREVIIARSGSDVVIECRPTAPDIKVNLLAEPGPERYNPKIGFVIDSDDLLDGPMMFVCTFSRHSEIVEKDVFVHKYVILPPPKPSVSIESKYFLEGESFSVNCSAPYQPNSAVMLVWKTPRAFVDQDTIIIESNQQNITDGMQYENLTIVNATRKDAGRYTCQSKNAYFDAVNASFNKVLLEKGFINLTKDNKDEPVVATISPYVLLVKIQAHPKADYVYYKNNQEIIFHGNPKYSLTTRLHGSSILLHINNLTVYDTANYTLVAKNKYIEKSVNFDLRVPAAPSVDFGPDTDKRYLVNSAVTLKCDVVGYPLPQVKWFFQTFNDDSAIYENKGTEKQISPYKVTSYLDISKVSTSGNITCKAHNSKGNTSASRRFLVYEVPNGFGIDNAKTWYSERDNVEIKCIASIYDFMNVTWVDGDGEDLYDFVRHTVNAFSYIAKLKIDFISLEQASNYTCIGIRNNGTTESDSISLTVAPIRTPIITEPAMDMDVKVYPYQPVQLTCIVDSVPTPTVEWFRDGEQLVSDDNVDILTEAMSHTTVNSTISIRKMLDEYKGKYECVTTSLEHTQERFFNILLQEKSAFQMTHLSIIIVIFAVLLMLVIYLFWKIRKEKQFRKELAAAGLLYFKEGVTKSLNPELGIDEQAELLPYDDKFEVPPEKLKLGKQLGAGAFGVVYKADARGIINAEETTTVAVKMVKKTADNMYIKALASELKIMVHLGKHINIVNLLGACTKNVGKRELIVIVEYCKFGNIHNYMQKHREVFIDQFSDSKEKHVGKVNRGFSCSNADSGSASNNKCPQQGSEEERNQSDYFCSDHTPDTGHTFLNTASTNRSSRKEIQNQKVELEKVSESGYVQPEWRSNYESDYHYDGRSPRPLCSRDLLCWAFQIARGMEYLASRKVCHGDLAARNILLADDNVVKICDFGLARSIYKNDEYHQKGSNPVPVKWLAIECLTDRIFSTQSDVWAFGVVLWELFTLAKTPYPSISHTSLLQYLNDGNRLEKPQYSDDRLYSLMQRCWDQKPTARPNFSQLQETLGSFLEDNVRNHYVDLNATYMDTNMRSKAEAGEDYLAMVCAPDYNNMVTPSPHHYVNDARSFFPITPTLQLQHDDEGYLQMSPATNQTLFSSRAPSAKFDFDARKLNPESSVHPELTPMLSLNNLPARGGSDSDLEGCDAAAPYLNMCPRIDEEADEVFHSKNNLKNITQNGAVTNPTYITFDVDIEKKPQDNKVSNSYVNMSVPNGLVK